MDSEQFAIRLQETADRSLRNEGRIKKLEETHEALHQLATSVAVLAEQMKAMHESVDTLADKVEELEDKPGKRWDSLVDKTAWAAAGAFLAWVLSGMPGVGA